MTDATTPAPGGARPCWWVAPDAASCGTTPTQLSLHVERDGAPATGTDTVVSCAVGSGSG
jgi:hypothetical protein